MIDTTYNRNSEHNSFIYFMCFFLIACLLRLRCALALALGRCPHFNAKLALPLQDKQMSTFGSHRKKERIRQLGLSQHCLFPIRRHGWVLNQIRAQHPIPIQGKVAQSTCLRAFERYDVHGKIY